MFKKKKKQHTLVVYTHTHDFQSQFSDWNMIRQQSVHFPLFFDILPNNTVAFHVTVQIIFASFC